MKIARLQHSVFDVTRENGQNLLPEVIPFTQDEIGFGIEGGTDFS